MIGKIIIELDRIDSTNTYASQFVITHEFDDGTVIWTPDQFAGRGQYDHQWISEAGKNLSCTICLQPRFVAPDRQFQLNKAVALGVLDFIRSFMHQAVTPLPDQVCSVKWPNDIYVGSLKIGGILIENRIMGSVLETSIAGIGLNINQKQFDPSIPNPVSLIQILRHETSLINALRSMCGFLNLRYNELRQTDGVNLDLDFDKNLLGFDEWRNFLHHGILMEGKIKGVDQAGRLLVETRHGEIISCIHHEISYLL